VIECDCWCDTEEDDDDESVGVDNSSMYVRGLYGYLLLLCRNCDDEWNDNNDRKSNNYDNVDIEIAITSHDNDDRNSNNYDDVDIEIAIFSHSIEVDFSMKEKIWLITMGVM